MIKLGFVGCGYWGPKLIRDFSNIDDVEVCAICDLDKKKLDYFSKKMPGVMFTGNYKDILNLQSLDGVVIVTPPHTHYEIARDFLSSGRHVFVEKPLTLDSSSSAKLVSLSKKKKRLLMVGHTFEYNPSVLKLRELVKNRTIGDMYYVAARRLNLGIIRDDINALWSLSPHDISILNFVLGSVPIEAKAWGGSFLTKKQEDLVFVNLLYPKNIVANIHVSWLNPLKVREMVFVGSKKMVVFDDVDSEARIKIYDKGADTFIDKRLLGSDVREFQFKLRGGDLLIPKIDTSEPLKAECCHFVECIVKNKKPRTDGENGLNVVRILEAAEKSLKKGGRPVTIKYGK